MNRRSFFLLLLPLMLVVVATPIMSQDYEDEEEYYEDEYYDEYEDEEGWEDGLEATLEYPDEDLPDEVIEGMMDFLAMIFDCFKAVNEGDVLSPLQDDRRVIELENNRYADPPASQDRTIKVQRQNRQ